MICYASRLAVCLTVAAGLARSAGDASAGTDFLPDYTRPATPFPFIYKPYLPWRIPRPSLQNAERAPLAIQDGKLRLSIAQLVAAAVDNNLAVASARYLPAIAQTDLMRARSGASPRGLDATVIPSGVFAGAQGGSILGTAAGGGGGGASNAGGITGAASQVFVRPAGVFDPTVSLNFSLDHTVSPLNTLVVAGVPSVTTATGAFSASYVQAFASGASFSLSYGFQRQGSTQLRLIYDPAFTPGFTFSASQQLANGFGTAVNRALIRVAENELKIERESFRQQVETAVANAEDAYWDLVAAQGAVRAAEQALEAAQQLAASNQKQFEIGTMANLDVVTADAQVAASRRDLIVARTQVENLDLQLKAMLSRRLDDALASAPIVATDALPDPDEAQIPTLEEAVATAQMNRPELSIAEGNIKSQQDAMPFIRNALLPNFNVFGLVTTVGLYNVFGTSFTEALQFRYPQVAFGVTLTFPFRNRQAQADEVRTTLELRQAKDTLVRAQSQVEVDVQNALIGLRQSRAQVAAARGAMRSEQLKLSAEQTKFAAGLSTSYNVVLVQRDLLAAQLAEVQAQDTFAKARVTLDQAMGVTLDRAHVTLDDALKAQVKP